MLSKEPQPENLNEDGERADGEITDRPPALPTRKRKTFEEE
jgi:hypothetical protein